MVSTRLLSFLKKKNVAKKNWDANEELLKNHNYKKVDGHDLATKEEKSKKLLGYLGI